MMQAEAAVAQLRTECTLAELEQELREAQQGYYAVAGRVLAEIRERRLYHDAGYTAFEDYCQERWGFTRRRANQLIGAADVVGTLGTIVPIPVTESQARELVPLLRQDEAEMVKTWGELRERYGDKVTAEKVREAVKDKMGGASQPMEITVFSHRSVEYYTPVGILAAAREVLGAFDLDPASCAEAQVNVQAAHFYTAEDNGLSKTWEGRIWLNPPYGIANGQSNQALWSQRLAAEHRAGRVSEAILLVKAALGYRWFEQLFRDWPVCFVRERISFIQGDGDDDGQSKQGTALVYFGPNFIKFARVFRTIGRVIPSEEVLDAALYR